MGRKSGEITVFFAICLMSIVALLLGLFESARAAGARLYFTQAASSAIESLFSQYHRALWKDYRLLGLEHYSDLQLEEELSEFMEPYFEVKDFYPLRVSDTPTVSEKYVLTDSEGEIYEKQVLEYMKYGLLEELWDLATATDMLSDTSEALRLKEIKNMYEDHSKEAAKLEKAIEKLNEKLKEQKDHYEEAMEALRDLAGRRLIKELGRLKKSLEDVEPLVKDYEKKADALSKKLSESQARYEEGKGDLSEGVRISMEADISEYSAYVDKDGERRMEISAMADRARENTDFVQRVIEVAEEVQDYIDSWEPSDEDDELDEEALWRPVERLLGGYDLLYLNINFGVADKEKEGLLERIGDFVKGDILELVLPEDAVIPEGKLDLSEAPSKTCFSGHNGSRLGILDRVTVTEYAMKEFNYYGRDKYGQQTEKKGSGHFELEYIYGGKETDRENLAEAASTLLAIREGLNLIYLFTDSSMRNQAKALAAVITGVLGFPPLISVMTFFILGIWALGQAFCDLKTLFAGGKVPILHTRESWKLDLDGLLDMGRSRNVASDPGVTKGLSYRDWMRILIFKDMGTRSDYRCMDMIQMNLKKEQGDFLLKRCAVSVEAKVKGEAGHVMFSSRLGRKYAISAETYYSY